jgi:5'-nucleotidase
MTNKDRSNEQPLILITNDDGIDSPGLWATVSATLAVGEVLVVAPDRQWSGGGRSMPPHVSGKVRPADRIIDGKTVTAYAVDASPALAVNHGILEFAPRRPSLVISGINSGANLGIEITISGTVGAALEAGAFGIPGLAVSLEMDPAYHLQPNEAADYQAAIHFTRFFARHLLTRVPGPDIDALNVNVPCNATTTTPWRQVRLSRQRYFSPLPPDRANGKGRPGYEMIPEPRQTEPDSDIWAIMVDRVVSVTPLSLDLTSRTPLRLSSGEAKDEGGFAPLVFLPLSGVAATAG